jgi:hypothetical protein
MAQDIPLVHFQFGRDRPIFEPEEVVGNPLGWDQGVGFLKFLVIIFLIGIGYRPASLEVLNPFLLGGEVIDE